MARTRSSSLLRKEAKGDWTERWLLLLLILMQNRFCVDAAAGRPEPKGKREGPEIIIVSDAVEGTFVDLGGKSLQEKQKWKASERVEAVKMG